MALLSRIDKILNIRVAMYKDIHEALLMDNYWQTEEVSCHGFEHLLLIISLPHACLMTSFGTDETKCFTSRLH